MNDFNKKLFKAILSLVFVSAAAGCTIGVANRDATADGRPLLWKTRDTGSRDNEIVFDDSGKIGYVSLVNAGSSGPWMGVNEKGFAIINSNSKDLRQYPQSKEGLGHSAVMKKALESCSSVKDFQDLLDKTNDPGRRTSTNFGVIDANGQAAIFETASKQYWKLDSADKEITPDGYIVHANFAFNGEGKEGFEKCWSYERYKRAVDLGEEFYQSGKIELEEILQEKFRDFADYQARPFDIPFRAKQQPDAPFGYINTKPSICRYYTASAAVFVGIRQGEDPRLSTMWAILGMPASGIAVPYWPVGPTPLQANGEARAALCDVSKKIHFKLLPDSEKYADLENAKQYFNTYLLKDASGDGLLKMILKPEDNIISQTQKRLEKWRNTDLNIDEMLAFENRMAQLALKELENIAQNIKTRHPVQ